MSRLCWSSMWLFTGSILSRTNVPGIINECYVPRNYPWLCKGFFWTLHTLQQKFFVLQLFACWITKNPHVGTGVHVLQRGIRIVFFENKVHWYLCSFFFVRYMNMLVISIAYIFILALLFLYVPFLTFLLFWSLLPCERDICPFSFQFSYLSTILINSFSVCREEGRYCRNSWFIQCSNYFLWFRNIPLWYAFTTEISSGYVL